MTKTQATRTVAVLERAGWADVRIMASDGLSRVAYGVSAVDPLTGYRTPWQWEAAGARGGDEYVIGRAS